MPLEIARNEEGWDSWYLSRHQAEFLQSWQWGVFQESVGLKVWRAAITEQGQVTVQFQGMVHRLGPGFAYFYIPRVPWGRTADWRLVLDYLRGLGYIFVRVELTSPLADQIVLPYDLVKTLPRQPADSLILDLHSDTETLFSNLHQKTRYNIRLAERKGITVSMAPNPEVFWSLTRETAGRDGFHSHEKNYYQKMLLSPLARQFTAWLGAVPLATNLCVGFGDTFTYLHGASGNEQRNLMAPFLLQWRQILYARENGYRYYDFWGIAPPVCNNRETSFHSLSWQADHEWTGITRFKAGFGGERRHYPVAVDIVLRPWLYRCYQKIKKFP